jgi:hypothetical protein
MICSSSKRMIYNNVIILDGCMAHSHKSNQKLVALINLIWFIIHTLIIHLHDNT